MNVTILLITLFILFNNIGYCVYEFKNNNKLGGITTLILNIFMVIFTNYIMFNFK